MANGLLLGTIANVKDKTRRNCSKQLFVHNLYTEPTDRQTAEIDLLQTRRSHLQTKQLPQTPKRHHIPLGERGEKANGFRLA